MKKIVRNASLGILLAGVAAFVPALADNGLSNASANSSAGASLITGSVIAGTISTLAGGSQLVVESIEIIGDSTVYVLKNVSTGALLSVKALSTVAGTVSVAVGTGITVVADASGHALMASGRMIAFIPNEIGKSLIHSKKSVERGVKL